MQVVDTITQKLPIWWKDFVRICPNWANYIEEQGINEIDFRGEKHKFDDSSKREWNMDNPRFCIVGESHGGTDDYTIGHWHWCVECSYYSFTGFLCHPFLETAEAFIQHWNEKHV